MLRAVGLGGRVAQVLPLKWGGGALESDLDLGPSLVSALP